MLVQDFIDGMEASNQIPKQAFRILNSQVGLTIDGVPLPFEVCVHTTCVPVYAHTCAYRILKLQTAHNRPAMRSKHVHLRVNGCELAPLELYIVFMCAYALIYLYKRSILAVVS
jgi:hypothetical protein